MHEVIGLRPDLQRFVLDGTVELSKKHFSDLKPLRGRDRPNDVKGVQKWRHNLLRFRFGFAAPSPGVTSMASFKGDSNPSCFQGAVGVKARRLQFGKKES
jgi:hypothetical protein